MARSRKALCRRVLVAFFAFVVASLGVGASALAEEGGIDYVAPTGCPAKQAFFDAIAARTAPSSSEADPRSFRAVIERSATGFDGRLEVSGDARVPRTTHASSCDAVVKTLAVFVVIARTPDPEAVQEPPAEDPPPPAPRPKRRPRPVPVPPAHHPSFRYVASLRPSILVPSVAGPIGSAVRVQGEVAWLPPRTILAPSLRLSFGTAGLSKDVDAGSASFRFRTGRAEGCVAIDLGRAFRALPCAGGELGDLVATTSDLPVPVRASTRWKAAAIGFGMRWDARPWLSLGADVTMLLPITRREFGLVDPIRVVYRVPAAYLDLGAALGVTAYFD